MGSCQSAFTINQQDSLTCTVESKMKSIHEMTKSTKLASLKLNNSIYVQDDTDYEVDEQIEKLSIHTTKLRMHQKYDFQQQENLFDSILECDVPSLCRSYSSRSRKTLPILSKYYTPKQNSERREIQRINISDILHYNNPCKFHNQETNSVKSILKSKTCKSFNGSQRSVSSKKVKFANGTKFGRMLVKSTRQLRK